MKDEILIKYLLGETTLEETDHIDSWLSQDSAHQQHYLQLQKLWDQSKLLEIQPVHNYDTSAEWQRLRSKLGMKEEEIASSDMDGISIGSETDQLHQTNKGGIFHMNLWKFAAAIAVMVFVCWCALRTLFFSGNSTKQLILTASASPVTDTLSDGSIITLNRYSSLVAPHTFIGKTREVTLRDGEAFFDIAHNAKQPFLVHIDAVDVKVLGTSFNIKRNGNQTVIDVATGKVMVNFKGKQLIMHENEKIAIDPSTTKLVSSSNPGVLYNYYVTKKFIANNTRLEDLVNILNEAYNQHIVFGRPELKDMRITTVFAQEPIEVILNVISETFGIKVIYLKDSIELK